MSSVATAERLAAGILSDNTVAREARGAELPIRKGSIGPGVIDIAALCREHDVFAFDPGFGVTAACESRITYIACASS